jgi:hypothetical protein
MTAPRTNLTSSDLKKQSQFAGEPIDINSYYKRNYCNNAAFRALKNKANQNQFSSCGRRKPVEDERKIGIIKRKQESYDMEVKYAFESS